MKTRLIISKSNNPTFNLATEEYILRYTKNDAVLLYINSSSIITGKHQNAYAEVNLPFIIKNNIPLYRRISGGGTVYHDMGNINFSFIKTGEPDKLINFKKSTLPIVNSLNQLGLPAKHGERNDITLYNYKISGNASHLFKKRVMHHGTLLFDSNLENLNLALKTPDMKYNDNAVKSIKSRVVNIKEFINKDITTKEFIEKIASLLESDNYIENIERSLLTKEEEKKIIEIANKRYNREEWNYNYGPSYELNKSIKNNGVILSLNMEVKKGVIDKIKIDCNRNKYYDSIKVLEDIIINKKHNINTLKNYISHYNIDEKLDIKREELLMLFF
ncbi:lipoate--protein ligase [Marinilabiliaceae bacterium ANBcel2]|nr:lipoate--protein ligase [Marinilabiliaceae bacterium ANBcel2]